MFFICQQRHGFLQDLQVLAMTGSELIKVTDCLKVAFVRTRPGLGHFLPMLEVLVIAVKNRARRHSRKVASSKSKELFYIARVFAFLAILVEIA